MRANIYRSGIAVNTVVVDYRGGIDGDNARMEIKSTRLKNLQVVLDQDFGGKKSRLADAMGVAPNNISRYFSENPEHSRTVSDEAARRIEEVTGRPRGWMDHSHEADGGVDLNREAKGLSNEKLEMLRRFIRSLKED